ncbi:membrane-associating domain-containing protein [Talaromyces proteolyticus]|uniref:Membrane-associating domain-containing protein n=1 Tax=Talaromyces proteolyticus TaxID=1131652 RepID=A0AAD4KI28_9EURO|nr:membrane-associating domain-containing protein [Talaromyces proteolyticus]KAH8690814.1 membrane-associating domain-containing protein [Talaromyces proteolyticus]
MSTSNPHDPVVPRPIAIPLRFALRSTQIAFAAIVAGLAGHSLSTLTGDQDNFYTARSIYAEVVAALSIVLGVVLMVPILHGYFVWPIDITISLAWFAAFGVLFNALQGTVCGLDPNTGTFVDCTEWKVSEAFAFLSAIVWLITGGVGIFYIWRSDQQRLGYWHGRYNV